MRKTRDMSPWVTNKCTVSKDAKLVGEIRTQYTDAGEIIFTKLSPEALVESAHTIVSIGSALSIRYTVEEVAIIGPLLPHTFHFSAAWLEVTKILLT
jgi:hypothetical protein